MISNTMKEERTITKKDLRKVAVRSLSMEWSWNYERQANLPYCFALIPVLSKLYTSDEERAEALKRHLEFFNTTPHLSTLLLGISAAMEEQNANDKNFDTSSINNIKIALMGPLAGIGDSFIWGTLRIIATGIGISLARQGNLLGPILFLLVFNIPAQGLRFFLMQAGYKLGADFLTKIEKSGLMESLTYGAAVLGLMVIGGMTAENVSINIPITIGSGNEAAKIGDICNGIMPGLLPLCFTFIVFYLLRKNFKTTTILLMMAVFGLAGAFFGFLG